MFIAWSLPLALARQPPVSPWEIVRQPATAAATRVHHDTGQVPAATAGVPWCFATSSITLNTSWPGAPEDVDLFYVGLAAAAHARPFTLVTSTMPWVVVDDLRPNKTYWITWRAHTPGPNVSLAVGWSTNTPAVACRTAPTPLGAPHGLERKGPPEPTTISFCWKHPAGAGLGGARVSYVAAGGDGGTDGQSVGSVTVAVPPSSRRQVRGAEDRHMCTTLEGLASQSAYSVVVGASPTGRRSDPVIFRTSSRAHAAGDMAPDVAISTAVYRVSEYTSDVDFLQNHDSGSIGALPPYLSRWAYWSSDDHRRTVPSSVPAGCMDALSAACPGLRGAAALCQECVANLSTTPPACTAQEGFQRAASVLLGNMFCGSGWPNFAFMDSPVAQYCVEHLPAPGSDDGFAPYLSCNCPEAHDLNRVADPICICWVAFDRVSVSNQNVTEAERFCDRFNESTEPQCNCTNPGQSNGSILVPDSDPSSVYVGR